MSSYGRQYAYCDEVAVSIAIDEKDIAKRAMDLRMAVELHGQMTRYSRLQLVMLCKPFKLLVTIFVEWTFLLQEINFQRTSCSGLDGTALRSQWNCH